MILFWFIAWWFTDTFLFRVLDLITTALFFFYEIRFFSKWRNFFRYEFEVEYLLLHFILKNDLEDTVFSYLYEEDGRVLHVRALKGISPKIAKIENLEKGLCSLFGYPLKNKVISETTVDYYFQKESFERIKYGSDENQQVESLEINLGYGQTYNMIKTPHILISGGTGSGKSVFISWLVLELLKRQTELYIVDPKHSDLSALKKVLNEQNVAVTLPQIAKVTRLAVEEMQKRYDFMNEPENFKYGSNFTNHGFKPVWLIFDEMGAFQSLAHDKESKGIVQEVMTNVKQIVLLGRQAGVFLLISAQQMSVNTLGGNSDIRDQLGMRIALGSNSSEGYRMVFGSHVPENMPDISVKGSGLLYMDGSGEEQAQYWEGPFVDMKKFNFLEEVAQYYRTNK